ncbi:3-hydroxyacyl-CoA dehydrogenase NAD-binding domain-containing protein [Sphingobium chlorophenolicum]|uniref:3-hydroxybutyryl-CoA epimerase n=1 Tax=Sphingobium chlorophenolicum TaxID=46429 RepID=A0A081RDF6_SPHCR|nr:3-hydroxyacyl-CoA dehydrogenase NAD-binding domain-containing protein [Sphingobium chlorophenolicum]KEQ53229.1 3-hydroxybutyryl-CoA epimerase [Sphingobium chlorophenolicum]
MTQINEKISTRIEGDIGFIISDNPPVNALGIAVRQGLVGALEELDADPAVKAIVLYCAGRTFFAGADITEFGKPRLSPTLQDVIAALENSTKPVVAAIHGTALGGGLETALGCAFRVAIPSAKVGLPEINLGLFAGGGGTQRLPRLIGPEKALEHVLSGKPVGAKQALELGIVDAVEDGDPAVIGAAFARRVIDEKIPAVPVRDRDEKLAATRTDPSAFDALAKKLTARSKGQLAPQANIDSIRRSFTMELDEAMAVDAVANRELMAGSQSRALRHLFFAEREAARIPGLPETAKARPVKKAAIIGAGTMGGGIAMCFAGAGIAVTVIDTTQDALDRGLDRVKGNYATSLKRGSITQAQMDERLALITGATDRAAAADADIVIEAVFEDMDVKKEIFSDLEKRVKPGTILASNTSALDVDEIASVLERPEDFVGMHFFSPANVMKLLEVVVAKHSSPDAILTAMAVGKAIGKVSVWSGNCDGFIGNRMVAKRSAQAERLLQQGAFPQQVDAALTNLGFPMGPLTTNDMSGLDIGYSIRKRRGTPFPIADAIVESGRLGQKTGAGYYRYEPGDRTPHPNPETEALIIATSEKMGIVRRDIAEEEMVQRLLFPLINEGARILEEGIALRASDVDLVWINGYGWPRHLGGPMFHADETGLAKIVAKLREMAAETPDDPSLQPAALLTELAEKGQSFAEWQKSRAAA